MISGHSRLASPYFGAGLYFERLGLVARRDNGPGIGHGADDSRRLATVFRMKVLLHRRKEAVQVDVQKAKEVFPARSGMERGEHGTASILVRRYPPDVHDATELDASFLLIAKGQGLSPCSG